MQQFQPSGTIDNVIARVEFRKIPSVNDLQKEIDPGGQVFRELFNRGYVDRDCRAKIGFNLNFSDPIKTDNGTYYLEVSAAPSFDLN